MKEEERQEKKQGRSKRKKLEKHTQGSFYNSKH